MQSTGIKGSIVTILATTYSFFSHSLVVVQWLAAAVAVVAGVLTVVTTLRKLREPK